MNSLRSWGGGEARFGGVHLFNFSTLRQRQRGRQGDLCEFSSIEQVLGQSELPSDTLPLSKINGKK